MRTQRRISTRYNLDFFGNKKNHSIIKDYARENPATGELAREEYERKEDEEQKLHNLVNN